LQLELEKLLFVEKVVISGQVVRSGLAPKEGSWLDEEATWRSINKRERVSYM
jgi:hypothetical protein